MRSPWLRGIVAALMVAGIVMSVGDVIVIANRVDYGYFANYDIEWVPVANISDVAEVTSVKTGSAAERDGIRAGDRIHFEHLTRLERVGAPPPNGTYVVTDQREGKTVILPSRARSRPTLASVAARWIWTTLRVVIEIAGLAIFLLRGSTVMGAGLAIYLFGNQFTIAAISGAYLGPVWVALYQTFVQTFTSYASYTAMIAVAFSCLSPSPGRSRAAVAVYIAAWAMFAAFLFANIYQSATGIALPYVVGATWYARSLLLLVVAGLVVFVVGVRQNIGSERRRLVVLTISLSIGALAAVQAAIGLPGLYSWQQSVAANICTIVMAVGLTYAIFVHRLFDVEFVLNRAVVFTIVSAIVVVAFAAVEWGIGTYATGLIGRAQSVALQMVIALGIGLWLRRLHDAVDRFVDRWLFEERHRRANALQAFAREAATASSGDALLRATIKTLRTFAGTSNCAVMLPNERGDFEVAAGHEPTVDTVERDDLVAMRLRASRRRIDRHDFPPLTYADVAFPMTVGHELAGIMLCSHPPRAEPYSPEELEALDSLSHELAMALVALELREARRVRHALSV